MNVLSELKSIISGLSVPVETGVFSGEAPDEYAVLVPLGDEFPLSGDDYPLTDEQSCRISLFTKGNYLRLKKQITLSLLSAGFTVEARRYEGYDAGAGYHQLTIDVAKLYDMQEE